MSELYEKATPRPWAYRPVEYDDWGFIRGAPDERGLQWPVALARAGGSVGEGQMLTHRENGTDPYGPNAELIVHAVNSIERLEAQIVSLRDQLEKAQAEADKFRAAVMGGPSKAVIRSESGRPVSITTPRLSSTGEG